MLKRKLKDILIVSLIMLLVISFFQQSYASGQLSDEERSRIRTEAETEIKARIDEYIDGSEDAFRSNFIRKKKKK